MVSFACLDAGFVYNRKLTAISSYNRAVFWPELREAFELTSRLMCCVSTTEPHKKTIEERLRKYWEGIKDKVRCN
jgi:hypothetical protein